MFFIAGITGRIGGAVAAKLLAEGRQVRALVRDAAKANAWARKGAELRLGDLTNPDALAAALEGVEAAFLMQPTPIGVTREFTEANSLNQSLVFALERAPPPRAVALSSVGSEQDTALGNITQTHLLERALERLSFPLAIVRPGSLLENYLPSLERAGETGVFDTFLQPIDRAFPMAATADALDLRNGIEGFGRPNLLLAGLTTDICLFWAAVDGQRLGYRVTVVADACGTMSALGDSLTYDRLRSLGIAVTVVNQVVTELVPNFGSPEGQKAQKIMADEIISKLA